MAGSNSGNTTNDTKVVEEIEKTPVAVQWKQTLELGYSYSDDKDNNISRSPVCFRCGATTAKGGGNDNDNDNDNKPVAPLSKCSRCNVASYCSRECQILDWKPLNKGGGGHKASCNAYSRLSIIVQSQQQIINNNGDSGDGSSGQQQQQQQQQFTIIQVKKGQEETIRNEIFGRIRIYACSFGVHKTITLGRGFLFVQSDSTLATLSTPTPKDALGYYPSKTIRAILMHYLTIAEYDGEVCRDDFELMQVRTQLQQCVAKYDEQTQLVILMRMRCGHVALGIATLVPDYRICKTLGQQYFADQNSPSVQLNLDDM